MRTRLVAGALIVLLATAGHAQEVGETIVVISQSALLRCRSEVTGHVSRGALLDVRVVNGDWFWVVVSIQDQTRKGWINRSDVAPLKAAVDSFNAEICCYPTPAAYARRARVWNELEEHQRALDDVRNALYLDPQCLEAKLARGSIHARTEDSDDAIADFDDVLQIAPDDTRALYGRAFVLAGVEKTDAALNVLDALMQIDPHNTAALLLHATLSGANEEPDRAEADLDAAIDFDPHDPHTRIARAFLRVKRDGIDEALADFNAALELNPRTVEALQGRGMIRLMIADLDRALEDFNAAIRVDPSIASAYNWRACVHLQQEDIDGAVADVSEAIRLDPSEEVYYRNRGAALTTAGKFADALADLDTSVRLDPHDANSLRMLAQLLGMCPDEKLRDWPRAIELALQACVESNWEEPSYIANFAEVFEATQEFDHAIKWLEGAQPLFPPEYHAMLVMWRAWLRAQTRDYELAIADSTRALELNGSLFDAYDVRGTVLALQGHPDEALADLTRAVELAPDHAHAHWVRAALWIKKQEFDKALEDLTIAIDHTDNEAAKAAMLATRAEIWIVKQKLFFADVDLAQAMLLEPTEERRSRLEQVRAQTAVASGQIDSATILLPLFGKSAGAAVRGDGDSTASEKARFDPSSRFHPNLEKAQELASKAELEAQSGNLSAAIQDLTFAIILVPGNEEFRRRRKELQEKMYGAPNVVQ